LSGAFSRFSGCGLAVSRTPTRLFTHKVWKAGAGSGAASGLHAQLLK